MKQHCLLSFFSLMLLLSIASCEEELCPVTNPQQAILGKWELIKQGSKGTRLDQLTDVVPSGYREFLNDSVYRFYEYESQTYTYSGDYTLNDSFLIYYYYHPIDVDEVDTLSIRHYYTFEDCNTLILDIDALAIFNLYMYKKIN